MMHRIAFVLAALLLVAAPGFSANFVALISETDQVLTTHCDGTGDPLADGARIEIYWDANNNGPDETDVRPELCKDAPKCDEGPAGTYNVQEFTLNGAEVLGQAGTFFCDRGFASVGLTPALAKYYVKVVGDGVIWTSGVFTLVPGPQEVECGGWSCMDGALDNSDRNDVLAITEYKLHEAYPNPFNPTTNLTFDLIDPQFVKLSVFNVLGQEVRTLVNGQMDAGRHVLTFDAAGLGTGLYMVRIEAGSFTALNKMLLMK